MLLFIEIIQLAKEMIKTFLISDIERTL